LGIFEGVNAGEVTIGQGGIGEWPEVFGRLEFGRIGQ
jgi:hypothetical protein